MLFSGGGEYKNKMNTTDFSTEEFIENMKDKLGRNIININNFKSSELINSMDNILDTNTNENKKDDLFFSQNGGKNKKNDEVIIGYRTMLTYSEMPNNNMNGGTSDSINSKYSYSS